MVADMHCYFSQLPPVLEREASLSYFILCRVEYNMFKFFAFSNENKYGACVAAELEEWEKGIYPMSRDTFRLPTPNS